jgi:hypothetical protein
VCPPLEQFGDCVKRRIADLRSRFTALNFAKITSKVTLVPDERSMFVAEDDFGAIFT